MTTFTFEVARSALIERRLEKARMLLVIFEDFGLSAVVLDDASGEFVRPLGAPSGPGIQPIALAPDGRSVLFKSSDQGLSLLTLDTGRRQRFEVADSIDRGAAMSPDGLTVAVVATFFDATADAGARDLVAIDVIDVATGRRRRLRSVPGDWSAETHISWSPDGLLVAASYLTVDDEVETVVLDRYGDVLRLIEGGFLPASSTGVWLNSREFTYITEDGHLVADHLDGRVRRLMVAGADAVAVVDDRVVWLEGWQPGAESANLITTDLFGNDSEVLVRVRPPTGIKLYDNAYATQPTENC